MRVDRRLNPACFSVASGVWRENVIWSNCSFVLYHSVVDADGEFVFCFFLLVIARVVSKSIVNCQVLKTMNQFVSNKVEYNVCQTVWDILSFMKGTCTSS